MSTAERLQSSFDGFSDATLIAVGDVADENADLSFDEFVSKHDIPDVQIFRPQFADPHPIEIIDFGPRGENTETLVYHESMGTSLDPSSIMHIAPIALALPDTRIIGVGSPGGPGKGFGKLASYDRKDVSHGALLATVEPILEYLYYLELPDISHVGYSYGADKALEAIIAASGYDMRAPYVVSMEPVTVKQRRFAKLAFDFAKTDKHLDAYVEAAASPAYEEARKRSGGSIQYILGLGRLTNLAIARGLRHDLYRERLRGALDTEPDMVASIMWGSESELAIDERLISICDDAVMEYGNRVHPTRLEGHTHAMCDDIFFHAATVLHGIEQATRSR